MPDFQLAAVFTKSFVSIAVLLWTFDSILGLIFKRFEVAYTARACSVRHFKTLRLSYHWFGYLLPFRNGDRHTEVKGGCLCTADHPIIEVRRAVIVMVSWVDC